MVLSTQERLLHFALALMVAGFLVVTTSSAWAYGSSSSSDEEIEEAEEAIDRGDFEDAIDILSTVLADDPDNADAYNFLAYSQRNLDQFDVAMENYLRALELDPDHKGALEYQGELFLMMGEKAAAEANLVRLSELCPRGCEEHEELQAAIERFKDGNVSWQPPSRERPIGE
jgi:Flp pilus assembly protein TadD